MAEQEKKLSVSQKLVQFAEKAYRFSTCVDTKEPFAVPIKGANIVLPLGGLFKSSLANDYRLQYRIIPNGNALRDAINVLQAVASDAVGETVNMRVGRHGDTIYYDLGDAAGRCVAITKAGWSITDAPPVLFRRTATTGAMPEPVRGGSIDELRSIVNMDDDAFRAQVAWMVNTLLPNGPHPVELVRGEQGTGKSEHCKTVIHFTDPSQASLCRRPKNEDDWMKAASSSWVFALDNVSQIPDWLSDAICRAVTGDASVERQLYTNKELVVLRFRRCIVINGIDLGALRDDFADRVLAINLLPFAGKQKTEDEIALARLDMQPRVFGALLDLLVRTLNAWPVQRPSNLARMADFHVMLTAFDKATGWQTEKYYLQQRIELAENVVEFDQVGLAIRAFIQDQAWEGTASQLWSAISNSQATSEYAKNLRSWPKTPAELGARLRRVGPALKATGVLVEFTTVGRDSDKKRLITISRIANDIQTQTDDEIARGLLE